LLIITIIGMLCNQSGPRLKCVAKKVTLVLNEDLVTNFARNCFKSNRLVVSAHFEHGPVSFTVKITPQNSLLAKHQCQTEHISWMMSQITFLTALLQLFESGTAKQIVFRTNATKLAEL